MKALLHLLAKRTAGNTPGVAKGTAGHTPGVAKGTAGHTPGVVTATTNLAVEDTGLMALVQQSVRVKTPRGVVCVTCESTQGASCKLRVKVTRYCDISYV